MTPADPPGLTSPENGAALSHPRAEILALTGLRGLAAVWIVLYHLHMPSSLPAPLRRLVDAGYLGVPLFVMLSGFVLAYNYPQLRGRRGLGRFYAARFARVVPLSVVVSVYLLVMQWAYHSPGWLSRIFFDQAWIVTLICCLYVAYPVILAFVRFVVARGLIVAFGTCLALEALVVLLVYAAGGFTAGTPGIHTLVFHNPVAWGPTFALGMVLAFAVMRGVTLTVRTASVLQLVAVAVVVAIGLGRHDVPVERFLFYGLLWSVPFGVLLLTLAVSRRSPLARLLSTRWMVRAGVLAFPLFLFHRPLLNGLGERLTHGGSFEAYLMVLAITGILLILAEGIHRYVEVPARTAVVAIARRLDRRSRVSAAPASSTPHP